MATPLRRSIRTAVEVSVALLVALGATLLLTSAAAYAECAWVLWVSLPGGGYFVSEAFESKVACDREKQSHRDREQFKPVDKRYLYDCFPDTIDPRGPKAR